jgi:hypothetical protein
MLVLDRFEGNFAVVEDNGIFKNISRDLIDQNIKEGSVIIKKGNRYVLDKKNSAARRKKISELQNSLFED